VTDSDPQDEARQLADELVFLDTPGQIRQRLGPLDRPRLEAVVRRLETTAADLRTRGLRADADLHARVAALVRAAANQASVRGPGERPDQPFESLVDERVERDLEPRQAQRSARPSLELAGEAPSPPGVFISYSRRDRAYVDQLVDHLQRAGIPIWVDRQRMPPGGRLTKEIRAAIAGCPAFVLVLSNASAESDWVDNEDAWARLHQRFRLALRLDVGAEWFSVAGLNIVDVTDGSMPPDDVVETLRRAVRDDGGAETERWERLTEGARLIDEGIEAQEARDLDRAERTYRRALELFEAYGSTLGIAAAYHQLGIVAQLRGDFDGALELYSYSLELNEIEQADGGEGRVRLDNSYAQIGQVLWHKGDFQGAIENLTRALELRRQTGDAVGQANSLHDLAGVHADLLPRHFNHTTGSFLDEAEGRELYERAKVCEEEALQLFTSARDRQGMAMATGALGRLAYLANDLDDAETFLVQSLNIKEVLGLREETANSLAALADVKLQRGRRDQAVPLLLRSLAIRDALGSPATRSNIEVLASVQADLGRQRFARLAHRDNLGDALATFDAGLAELRR
jgi:tetratricopeptide (TPR) repeat protein